MSCGCWREAAGVAAFSPEVSFLFSSPWLGMFQHQLLQAWKVSVKVGRQLSPEVKGQ